MYPDMTVAEYRKYASLRVEALNHALRDIPEDKIRLHICWGSNHGPHKNDIPFTDIIDIFLAGARVAIRSNSPTRAMSTSGGSGRT